MKQPVTTSAPRRWAYVISGVASTAPSARVAAAPLQNAPKARPSVWSGINRCSSVNPNTSATALPIPMEAMANHTTHP